MRPKKPQKKRSPPPHPDAFAAEVLTVAWMLTVITALGCELGSAAARIYLAVSPNAQVAAVVSEVLFLSAVVAGLLSLVLAAAVFKVGRVRPPRGVTVFAIVTGIAPLAALLLKAVLRGPAGD